MGKPSTGNKWSEVIQSCLTLCDPMDCSLPSSSIHGILQARILEWVAISFSRESSLPRDRTQVSRIGGRRFNLWATREAPSIGCTWSESHSVMSDSLRPHGLYNPWNSPGQNTGVGSLSLLQGIFPAQGLNPGLWHCGQILYQLNYKGSPGNNWSTLQISKYPGILPISVENEYPSESSVCSRLIFELQCQTAKVEKFYEYNCNNNYWVIVQIYFWILEVCFMMVIFSLWPTIDFKFGVWPKYECSWYAPLQCDGCSNRYDGREEVLPECLR